MRELSEFLGGRSDDLELDRGALLLARFEYPELEIAPFLAILDSYAAELGERVAPDADGPEFIAAANLYLFEELGFRGNAEDYYNPLNSCLNEVIASRAGIPISLSVVYLEIGRRLDRPLAGIGLPGHFVIRYDDGAFSAYLDPFHGGRLLEVTDCFELAKRAGHVDPSEHPRLLAPIDRRQILQRMANNLRGIYFSRRAHRKLLALLNLLIAAHPDSAEEYKQRGLVYLQTDQPRLARGDLERYLELAPEAADRAEIEKQVAVLRRWVAAMN